jgi:Na+/melibiose symporter-like transporter
MDSSTVQQSLPGIQLLMSWIPAAFAFAAAALMIFYPLNCQQNKQIGQDLLLQRKPLAGNA